MVLCITPLPSPFTLKSRLSISPEIESYIKRSRDCVKSILSNNDTRKLLIIGPCSIHDTIGALEYARKLRELQRQVEDQFFIVMRVYFEKPRSGLGWKGLLHDPFVSGTQNIDLGLRVTRSLLLDIAAMGVPIASELLDPSTCYYFDDLISWGSIGARTSFSQIHRQLSSGLPFPIGFKNATDGTLESAINGIRVAMTSNCYIGIDQQGHVCEVQTGGNSFAHLVLRGGDTAPNYEAESVANALNILSAYNLQKRLIIDCAHGNSSKVHERQIGVFNAIIDNIANNDHTIAGLMVESFLNAGNQPLPEKYGISITDPCLSWEASADLILAACERLSQRGMISEKSIDTSIASYP